mgnify:CR=1 FL=1
MFLRDALLRLTLLLRIMLYFCACKTVVIRRSYAEKGTILRSNTAQHFTGLL